MKWPYEYSFEVFIWSISFFTASILMHNAWIRAYAGADWLNQEITKFTIPLSVLGSSNPLHQLTGNLVKCMAYFRWKCEYWCTDAWQYTYAWHRQPILGSKGLSFYSVGLKMKFQLFFQTAPEHMYLILLHMRFKTFHPKSGTSSFQLFFCSFFSSLVAFFGFSNFVRKGICCKICVDMYWYVCISYFFLH